MHISISHFTATQHAKNNSYPFLELLINTRGKRWQFAEKRNLISQCFTVHLLCKLNQSSRRKLDQNDEEEEEFRPDLLSITFFCGVIWGRGFIAGRLIGFQWWFDRDLLHLPRVCVVTYVFYHMSCVCYVISGALSVMDNQKNYTTYDHLWIMINLTNKLFYFLFFLPIHLPSRRNYILKLLSKSNHHHHRHSPASSA